MGYDYLITLIKVVLGLVTPERLMYFSIGVIGVFLIWVILSLALSFPRRFYTKSAKLYTLLKKDAKSANSANLVKKYSRKISNGFDYGWNRFMKAESGKPSDFITRSDALENDVSGGVFNQGKSIMKSFIWLMTVFLFIVNLGYHGGENPITFMLLVESSVLPILFFCALRIFYYLYTVVRQQLYKLDVEIFYELIELLDETFEKKPLAPKTLGETNLKTYENEESELKIDFGKEEQSETDSYALNQNQDFEEVSVSEPETEEVVQDFADEKVEQEDSSYNPSSVENDANYNGTNVDEENQNEESQNEQSYETEPENELDKYDVFKKKNINVDELANEVPKSSKTLPFINVDSDYVIKDDTDAIFGKRVSASDNGSTVLGVMQDMSSMKKEKSSESEEDQDADPDAEAQYQTDNAKFKTEVEDEVEPNADVATNEEAETQSDVVTEDESKFDAEAENSFEEDSQDNENMADENEAEIELQTANEPENQEKDADDLDEDKEETPESEVEENSVQEEVLENNEKDEDSVEENVNENESNAESEKESENEEDRLASIVSNFKSSSAKQIKTEPVEDTEPIARRKSTASRTNFSNERKSYSNMNNAGGMATNYQGMYQGGNTGYVSGYGYPQSGGFDGVVGYENYFGTNPADFGQNMYDPDYKPNFQEQILAGALPKVSVRNSAKNRKPAVEEKPEPKPQPQPKTKPEPKASETKQKSTVKEKKIMPEIQDQEPAKKRGRPKKQVFDDEVTINSDKEFDEVLSRAEKLMRKSEEGLSASQSKRIEKELKMLMDAMNKYKEKR